MKNLLTLLKKIVLGILILFIISCNKDVIETGEMPNIPSFVFELEIEIENCPSIIEEIMGCDLVLSPIISRYSFSGNDTLSGHYIHEEAINYYGLANQDKDIVGFVFYMDKARMLSALTTTEVTEFVEEFSNQKFDTNFMYPIINIIKNDEKYTTIKLDKHSSDVSPRNFDKNALINIDYLLHEQISFCNREKLNVQELKVQYYGKLYNESFTDSIQINSNYSILLE